MALKKIQYDVRLLSTEKMLQGKTPIVYTNDLNSAEFVFNIFDMTAEQLAGATATTLLYMRDGSFFQNSDVNLNGNTFTYLLKENEGNHAGLAKIQLVVKIGTAEYASQLYSFEVVNGLETKVAVEVMIQDWTTLLREARAYIAQFLVDEEGRQATFVANEQGRQLAFEAAEELRQQKETERQEEESGRIEAEALRQVGYDADHGRAETDHTTAVNDHSIAVADHTTAVADHTMVQGYNTRLTAEETATANNKISAVKGKTFADVDARFEELEAQSIAFDAKKAELSAQLAEIALENVGFNLLNDTLATLVGTEYYNSPFVKVPAETRICISTASGFHGYITAIKWYDADKVEILPAPTTPYDSLNSSSSGVYRSGKFITTPVNCVYITFTWRFRQASTSKTLANQMMVNVNDGVTDALSPYQDFKITKTLNPNLIKDLKNDVDGLKANQITEKVVYVSPAGDDMNDGKAAETPYKTFEKATGEKPSIIYAFRGVYKYDSCIINNQESFAILPFDNDLIYTHDNPIRPKIVIDNGEVLEGLTLVNGLLEKTYSGGAFFNDVFVSKTINPMINAKSPRAVVWQEFSDKTLNTRLTPLLTKAEVIAQIGSFTWDGTKIYINPFAGNTSRFVVAKTSTSVLDVKNVKNLMVEDVECLYQFYNNITLHNIGSSEIRNSHVKYANSGQGFSLNNTNSNLYNCTAFKVGNDGFNMHEYGDTNFFNCKGTYCYDDGMSHHYGCTGTVHGGEYSFNGKGGILPAYGANVDIYNTVCEGNVGAGIGYLYTPNGHAPMKGYINGNVLVNNAMGLSVGKSSEVTSVGTIYSGNTTNKNVVGVLREY